MGAKNIDELVVAILNQAILDLEGATYRMIGVKSASHKRAIIKRYKRERARNEAKRTTDRKSNRRTFTPRERFERELANVEREARDAYNFFCGAWFEQLTQGRTDGKAYAEKIVNAVMKKIETEPMQSECEAANGYITVYRTWEGFDGKPKRRKIATVRKTDYDNWVELVRNKFNGTTVHARTTAVW